MAEPNEKRKVVVTKRTPKKVTPSGIFDNLRRLPHPMEEMTGFAQAPQAPLPQTAPTIQTAPVTQPAPVTDTPQPLPVTPAVSQTPPVTQVAAGFTKITNEVCDSIIPTLDTYSQSVLVRLLRLAWGFRKDECRVGLPSLAKYCNISESQARRAVRILIQRNLIEQTAQDFSNPVQSERGTTYKILVAGAPSRQTAPTAQTAPVIQPAPVHQVPNTDKHTTEHTHTETGVRVGSNFSLSECRRYADHLNKTGQGIVNPGGYATKIHRSGEADDLIAAFLSPSPAQANVDISRCPDCRGTGFYEPGGAGMGVARCRHEKLLRGTSDEP